MIMERFTVKEIKKGIWAIEDGGDDVIYLFEGHNKALLMDTGMGVGDLKAFVEGITNKPYMVINSHGHPDHVSGNHQFESIHITDQDRIHMENCFYRENRLFLRNMMGDRFPAGLNAEEWLNAKPGSTKRLCEGQLIDLGGKTLEVISVPGHTPGSIALLDVGARLLFSADSVFMSPVWLHLEESLPLDQYLEALMGLKRMEHRFDRIYTSHSTDPLVKSVVDVLIEGVGQVLAGSLQGTFTETFAGNGLTYQFDGAAILAKLP